MVQKEKKYITWEGLNQHAKNVGKKIKEYDAGVIGGYNGSFPLTAATKGNIYLLPATKKYYVCIENYNGSQLTAPNANFEELSVYTNRSKLDNLFTYNDSTFNIGNIKFLFSSFKTTENGNVIIKIDNPNFKSVLFCDCRSDFYRTYPNNLPVLDYYGDSNLRFYIPSDFPIGNNIHYMIIGTI